MFVDNGGYQSPHGNTSAKKKHLYPSEKSDHGSELVMLAFMVLFLQRSFLKPPVKKSLSSVSKVILCLKAYSCFKSRVCTSWYTVLYTTYKFLRFLASFKSMQIYTTLSVNSSLTAEIWEVFAIRIFKALNYSPPLESGLSKLIELMILTDSTLKSNSNSFERSRIIASF